MVIGNREETIEEKRIRHMKEAHDHIQGWNKELLFAREKSDKQYQKYCELMIQILENTVKDIEGFKIY